MSEDAASSSGHSSESPTADLDDPQQHDQLAPLPTKPLAVGDVVMTDTIRSSWNHSVGRKMINQYEFDRRVGKGQHGDVYLARDTSQNSMKVAIKSIKRKNPKVDKMSMLRKRNLPSSSHLPLTDNLGSTEHKIRKEIAIMKKCRHPHVVRLLEVMDDKLNEKIYMVMEYLGGGEIKWRTKAEDPVLRVDQTRRICRDVILGLEYLHHQGIIHRDIKPANLLWSADRRTVKITDFGVSHFSYAQRLAAAGESGWVDSTADPILMDDSDLSKTAGTPMFLAPEIVSDSTDLSASSSTLQVNAPRKKPPITKAIDVWAFGVTLYGLLFGNLPFNAEQVYQIYQVIRRHDWDVPVTMGVDQIPVGGRHQRPQPKGEETEGYLVVKLLQRLLEKDARKRITLDEVKRDPWILRDMTNPQEWLQETKLDRDASLEPTADETSSAMSSVRFRWTNRITHHLSAILRTVRPQRSFRRNSARRETGDEYKDVGVSSAPNYLHLSRHRSQAAPSTHSLRGREKSKQRAGTSPQPDITRNKSTTDVHSATAKGFEPWAMWAAPVAGSGSKSRRGSFSSKTPDITLLVPKSRAIASPQPSPQTSSLGELSGQQSPEERPRSRLSLSGWMRNWRGTPKPSYGPPPQDAGTSSGFAPSSTMRRSRSGAATRESLARRSEDAFNRSGRSRQSSGSGPLTVAMRAASWGEMADYERPSEDMTSLYSGERADDVLDDDTLLLGAGGVAQSPVQSIPSGLLSTVSSIASLGPAAANPPTISAAHAILQRAEVGEHSSAPDPTAQDAGALARQSQIRARTTSPLAQMSYNRGQAAAVDEFDDASLFECRSRSDEFDIDLQPSTSQMYQDEDEESDSSERWQLEVRTRRPSVSAAERSPPRNSDSPHSPHRERPMISCI